MHGGGRHQSAGDGIGAQTLGLCWQAAWAWLGGQYGWHPTCRSGQGRCHRGCVSPSLRRSNQRRQGSNSTTASARACPQGSQLR